MCGCQHEETRSQPIAQRFLLRYNSYVALRKTPHHIKEDHIMSSRKRTPDQPSTETSTATADPPAVATDTPPAANDNRPSFAERVGQRKRIADPFGSAIDTVAGVRFLDSKEDQQVALKFEERPSQAVIDKVKEHGYHWNSFHRIFSASGSST